VRTAGPCGCPQPGARSSVWCGDGGGKGGQCGRCSLSPGAKPERASPTEGRPAHAQFWGPDPRTPRTLRPSRGTAVPPTCSVLWAFSGCGSPVACGSVRRGAGCQEVKRVGGRHAAQAPLPLYLSRAQWRPKEPVGRGGSACPCIQPLPATLATHRRDGEGHRLVRARAYVPHSATPAQLLVPCVQGRPRAVPALQDGRTFPAGVELQIVAHLSQNSSTLTAASTHILLKPVLRGVGWGHASTPCVFAAF